MRKQDEGEQRARRRRLEDLNLMDDFLFQEMLSQKDTGEEFCRILLGTILGKQIRRVEIIPQKNILGIDTDRHGIRMDAYIRDVSDEEEIGGIRRLDAQVCADIYDVEPGRRYEKNTLPRRARYYHGLMDTQFLAAGAGYEALPNVVIIIILPYDPFGEGRMVYTVKNMCEEQPGLSYDDGAKKIYLYTKGTKGNPSQALCDMLKYMEHSNENNVTNQDIEAVHRLVSRTKRSREVGINYMKSWERDRMMRREGEEEFAELTQRLLEEKRTDDLMQAAKDPEYREALYREFGIQYDNFEERVD